MAAEIKRHSKPEAIWLFDYNSLASMDDCPELPVWLSERDINLIWQAVLNIDRFRSRVFTAKNGDNYTIADLDQFGNFREWVSDMNVHLGDFLMCNELLGTQNDLLATQNELLERMALALENQQCCPGSVGGGSAGAGLDGAPPETSITSTEEAREGPPPEGFDTWPEFDDYKCDMAHYIIGQMIIDIATTGLLTAGGAGITALAGALVAALFTPIGWAIMISLAGLAISWWVTGASVGLLTSFLEAKKNELVCAMLDGDTVANSIDSFTDSVDTLVPDDPGISALGSIGVYLAKQYITKFATTDSFNRLYRKVAYEFPRGLECDCGVGCEGAEWSITYGDLTDGEVTDTTVTITSVAGPSVGGSARYWIVVGYTCDVCYRLTIASSGYTRGDLGGVHNIGNLVYLCSGGGTEYDLQMANTPDDWSGECFWPASSGGFQFNSRTPFTLTVTVTEVPCT